MRARRGLGAVPDVARGSDLRSDLGSPDTAPPYSASWNTTGFGDGAYDLRVTTTDNLGNSFTSAHDRRARGQHGSARGARSRARCDRGVPEASRIYFKANAAGPSGSLRRWRIPARVPHPRSSRARHDWRHIPSKTVTTTENGPYTSSAFSWTSGASTPGTYTVSAADGAGNGATSALAFTGDSAAPTGAVTAPAAASSQRGAVNVTSNSADALPRRPAQLHLACRGGDLVEPGPRRHRDAVRDELGHDDLADGLYDLRVITTDNVGNSLISGIIANVRVDNTAPSGSLTAPAASAMIDSTYALSSDSADGGSGVANAIFQPRSPAPTPGRRWERPTPRPRMRRAGQPPRVRRTASTT